MTGNEAESTDGRAEVGRVNELRAVASRAARTAVRRRMVVTGATAALITMVTGVLDVWVSNRWLWFAILVMLMYLTFRAADRIQEAGRVRARPTRLVVLGTGAFSVAAVVTAASVVGPTAEAGLVPYAIAAAAMFGAWLLGAWWVCR